MPDGRLLLKHANAGPALEGNYRNGKAEGSWHLFYPNGKLQSEVAYRTGKPEGIARRYWSDGKIAREEEYSGGTIQGWRVYDKNGVRQSEFRKRNNQSFAGPGDDPCSQRSPIDVRPSLVTNICNDPTAHCLPDQVVERGLRLEGTRVSEPAIRPARNN